MGVFEICLIDLCKFDDVYYIHSIMKKTYIREIHSGVRARKFLMFKE